MGKTRTGFQGITNIIRFNWHFYLLSVGLILLALSLNYFFKPHPGIYIYALCFLAAAIILTSLLVSFYVYDVSALYDFKWLDEIPIGPKIVNIHAGFDETSELLINRFPGSELTVFDFYDPVRHTEVSIKRARRTAPPFPGTRNINTGHLPLPDSFADNIMLTFAAHEIRKQDECLAFFVELKRALKETGNIAVTEHLRDLPNFLAYNIGFFHFHSRSTWERIFKGAGLFLTREIKTTPFTRTFILSKHDSAS